MALSRKYDYALKLASELPLPYVRALAKRESNLDPRNVTPPGAPPDRGARGLMQVMNVNRRDYNDAHGTDWTSADMLDPRKNVRVFSDTVRRMLRVYRRDGIVGEKLPTTERELLLITAGWNSGYGDVVRIADYLRRHDLAVNHDNLFRYAGEALADPGNRWTDAKRTWQRSVVRLYERELNSDNDTEGDAWWTIAALWILFSRA